MGRKSKLLPSMLFGLLFGLLFKTSAYGQNTVALDALARSNDWKKLLHYQNDESLIDYGSYFLSKNGKTDPLAELLASLRAFRESPIARVAFNQDIRCLFPYRFNFLKRHFADLLEPQSCPALQEWLEDKSAEKTVLVFAAEYANNPASMMGHTFLRFQRPLQKINQRHVSFLDPTFNFAARIPDDVGSLSYAVKGMIGGFEAGFGADTFENMIERYNNMESRDIWEYQLKLDTRQTTDLLLHLYELMTHAKWDYYFFDENCSFHILKTLEAVVPEKNPTEHLTTPWAIPIDTIRSLAKADLIERWTYRPSVHTRSRLGFRALTRQQRQQFHLALKKGPLPTDSVTLDTMIQFLNYRKHSSEGHLTEDEALILKSVLRRRATLGEAEVRTAPIPPPPPQSSTGTMRWGAGLRREGKDTWILADVRPAVHEIASGTLPTSSEYEVVFLAPSLRYQTEKRYLDLDHLTLISTVNYRDTNPVGFSPVWRILVDVNSSVESCQFCKYGRFSPATGFGSAAFNGRILLIGLATMHLEYGTGLPDRHRLGPGAEVQTFLHAAGAKLMIQGERWWDYRKTVNTSYSARGTIGLLDQSELWLAAGKQNAGKFLSVTFNMYR